MRFISTTAYYFPFFLLTLGPFPFPPSTVLTIRQHLLQFKQLLRATAPMGGSPTDPRRILVTVWGLFMWKDMHMHPFQVSQDCVFPLSLYAPRFQFDFDSTFSSGNSKQRYPFFCTFSPCSQKVSAIHTPPSRLSS